MSATGRSYGQIFFKVQCIILLFRQYSVENRSKHVQLSMKRYSVSIRLLTAKNNSRTDLRTSHAQLLEKGCQYREEDYENKNLSLKEYITGKKVKIIKIIFPFCPLAG